MAFLFNKRKAELILLTQQNENLRKQANEVSDLLSEIGKGNFAVELSEELSRSMVGESLASLKNYLQKISVEEKNRSWFNMGVAQFADLLRNKESFDLKKLVDHALASLVKYVNCNQGSVYLLEEEAGDPYLQLLSCYAYNKKKFLEKRIDVGQGLVGQCVMEREVIYMTEVPANYVTITSGLGETTPRCILISPLITNDKVYGVLELASLTQLTKSQIEFVSKISENLASTIKNVRDNEKTRELLNSTQQQTEELRSQEEEMRQNMEELQATQEEMARKGRDLERAMAEMKSILQGINATMATIEFEPDGTIISANDNFLNTMKYSLSQIRGEHHRMFVPKEILQSDEYRTFWKNLAAGKSLKGVFKRTSSTGDTVWLNAIYNPILNEDGEVIKVIKFATDITAEQEMLAQNKGVLDGINATMATIEFEPDGTILTANENFLNTMKYSLPEIKGQHHRIFVPVEVRESDDYKLFWKKLAAGESLKGVFKRISSKGETVWLDAIYNPILNSNGEVIKVVKFATDITREKEMTHSTIDVRLN